MSNLRWFLWTFMVWSVMEILADIDVAMDCMARGEMGPMWYRWVQVLVKSVLVVWAYTLVLSVV